MVELTFHGDQPLRDVMTDALAGARQLALDPGVEARVNVILEELLVNIFEHGGLASDGIVSLSLGRAADAVCLELTDAGRSFDPRSAGEGVEVPDRGGGAGLMIVRKWAELRSYAAGPPTNRLVLSIPFSRP